MNDKELLMMAAKAAGVEIHGWFEDDDRIFADIGEAEVIEWSPLTDDGDALRLAVKLEMDVVHYNASVECYFWLDEENDEYVSEEISDCRLSATRRAMVRAAAEIGSKL